MEPSPHAPREQSDHPSQLQLYDLRSAVLHLPLPTTRILIDKPCMPCETLPRPSLPPPHTPLQRLMYGGRQLSDGILLLQVPGIGPGSTLQV